ncbi:DUF637 domain-containing protein [Pseudomonas mucidolens]|uniref:two-partner secretion domain-containing protein n=1 Tax=Pseudomonas mucidolens TaxID=46679 RepID=UPI0030DBA413
MDVRQFAFLVRQPSATLKNRDAFWGLPKRGVALILANAMFWQPLLVQADGIVVSGPGTTLGQAGNGVPVVNIATPNGSGLSHNTFKDYNVGANGVILNNASGRTQSTQLGGIILGNPNLKGGAANIILNEVNGGSPSQLRGYTEVAGQSAKVIVANPYGVTCNGCGFINTPNVTLTTGKPILDNGRLDRYQVDGGAVTIDGQGLNASNVDRFEIITRSAKINAQINARNLTVIAGRNDVNAQNLKTTARADDGSAKPELAIDSSALGGMYAGAIKLVGTEAGVGVKLDGTLAASGGDIQLDANGRLSMAQAAATGNLKVTAQSVNLTDKAYATGNVEVHSATELVNRKSLAAGQRIEINAVKVTNAGVIEAGVEADNRRNATGDLVVNAQTMDTRGSVLASRAVTLNATQELNNQSGVIQAKAVNLTSAKLTNQGAAARVYGEQTLMIGAPAILNLGGLIRFGADQAASLQTDSLDNRQGHIEVAGGSLDLNTRTLNNQGGQIIAGSLGVTATSVDNQSGLLAASLGDAQLSISATLDNRQGKVQAGKGLTTQSGDLLNQNGVLVADAVTLNATNLDNSAQGLISAEKGALKLTVSNAFNNNLGNAQASTALNVTAASLANQGGTLLGQNLLLNSLGLFDNRGGTITGDQLTVVSQNLNNTEGLLQGRELLSVTASDLANQNGKLVGGILDANLGSLSDNDKGVLSAETGTLTLAVAQQLNNAQGRLQAGHGDIDLQAAGLDNQGGVVVGKKLLLKMDNGHIDNRAGRMVGDQLDVLAASLDNRNAGMLAAGAQGVSLVLRDQLLNAQGRVQSDGRLYLQGERLDNGAGILLGGTVDVTARNLDNSNAGALVSNGGDITLNVSELLTNASGVIDAGERSVLVKALTTLDNQNGTLKGKHLDIAAQRVNNDKGQLLAGNLGLIYTGQSLTNRQGMILSNGAATQLNVGSLSNQGGTVQGDSLSVTGDSLDNSHDGTKAGLMASLLGDLQLTVESVINRGGRLFGKEQLTVNGATLENSANGQISGSQLKLTSDGQMINQGGLIEATQGLTVSGGSLDNSAGGKLRALSGASSTLSFTGEVNNQNGILEFASQAFTLSASHLNNQSGQLQHAGSGLFSINTSSLAGSQGTINGLGSANWAFGNINGLGRLQLNDTLRYTSTQGLTLKAGDRMASGKGLILEVASLDNGGELLSDGDLSITLSGDMTNSGRLSAQQKLTLVANNLTQNGGRLASGTTTRITLGGTLDNLGYLTAGQQLDIAAAQINNRGTLGSQGQVTLAAVNGINNAADTLLFSGGDMMMRANGFSNLYGDVYSKGNLNFTGADGGRAVMFSNLSGTVESEGAIAINAGFIENAKAEFELGQTLTTGSLSWVCGQHCNEKDSWRRGVITINQTYSETAIKDSASARLVSGQDMTLQGDNVQNRYSLLAANGNLAITANDLLNQGAGQRTGQQKIVFGTPGHVDKNLWERMEYVDVPAFNKATAAGNFDKARFETLKALSPNSLPFLQVSDVTTWTENGEPAYAATLQAGGSVNLNVARTLQNGTLHENTLAQLTGTLGDDQTGIPVGGININLSQQASDASAQAPATVKRVEHIAADGSTVVSFVPVDYTGVPFAPVDPTAAPNFQLPKGDYGLFIKNIDPSSHYLIETNPNLTTLSGFFSSDYLLGKLGYDPDEAWRRLGDGQYESRLIRDAVLAQTGQRFLAAGLSSDYDQFRYLMDNALASKDALRLSVGVTLTEQQVSALTHDIVWMENRVVDGQTVLVPVLYLADADARNVRGNSLIQGRDLNLITGGDLVNVGTLRASNNLTAVSSGSIYTGGLAEAGNNLSLLAQNSIRNAMAGEIRGKQVSLTALKGDFTNDSTAIQVRDGAGMRTLTDTSAGTIVARENLAIDAGRDFTNRGAITAGGDASLTAGRDLNLLAVSDTSVKHELSDGGEKTSITTDVKNLAASVTAGGSLNMKAGQDINVVGSTATAGKDLNIQAVRDLNIASVSDEHNVEGKEKDGKKRIKTADEQTTQVASVLTAGGNFTSQAGRDTTIVASKISAGNEAYLYSGERLNLLAAQNSMRTLYDMKKNSGWGSKKTQRDEVSRITNVGTEIKTGGDLTLKSGGDQTFQLAKLQSGKDIILDSSGVITFEAVKDLHQESHEKSNNNAFWMSSKGKGNTDETLRQSQLIAEGSIAIKAVEGLKIDVKQVNQQTVSQSIDAMVKADPQLAWIKDAEARGDVDWRQVKEIHDSFKYSNSGLGPASQIIIAIVMAAVVGPMAAGAMGTATAGAVTAGTISVEVAGGISAAAGAVASGAATNATVSTINNRGNLGAVFKDVTSSDAMKGYAISGIAAGLTAGYFDKWTGTETNTSIGKVTVPGSLSTWSGVGQFAANQTLQNGTTTLLSKALGQGGSASDALKSALFNTLAAASFNLVGNYTEGVVADGSAPKVAIHAMVGGLLAEATGGDFKTGALAAGANEALVTHLDTLVKGNEELLTMSSQIVGVLAAAGQKDADAASMEKAAWVAKNATQYNYLGEHQKAQREKELAESEDSLERLRINTKWELIDAGQDASFAGGAVVGVPEGLLDTVKGILEVALSPRETYRALRAVLVSGDVLGNVSESMKQSYITRIDNLEAEYERAGASGSFNAGRETGKLISDVVALGTGVGGALKSGALLVEKITAKVVKTELATAKGAATGKVPYSSTVSADAEAGMPYTDPIKDPGAKATPSGLVSGETGVVGTGKAAANDASFTATSTSGWTSISSDARAVVRDVEYHSGVPMPSNQRTQLAEELRQVDHTYVAPRSDYQALQREYNSQRNNLKREWELNTGLTWPKTESGVDFQAHHVIPQQYGGPNQWWNLHPVPGGSAHQGGVHAPASPTTTAFPQKPPRRP